MKYNILGNTGVLVSELCFGTMTFGGNGFWEVVGTQQQQEADELLKMAVDKGINFIDTANVYSFGQSEQILGQSLKNLGLNRHDFFVATKVCGAMGKGVNQQGLSRYHVFQSVNESLERMQLDHIDLLYVHGVDPALPVEQIVHTLHDIVQSGKVRYVGVCNWPAWMVMKALGIARRNGWHEFMGMQYYYSLAGRDAEREILPLRHEENLGFMPWSPLAGGLLSGKFTRENENTGGESRRDNFDFPPADKKKAYNIIDELIAIGNNHGVAAAEIALAWLRYQPGVTSTIIGAKNNHHLQSNIHSTEIELTDDELNRLHEVSQLPSEYPGWMVEFQTSQRYPEEKVAEAENA